MRYGGAVVTPWPSGSGTNESPTNLRTLGRVRVLEALTEAGRLSRPDLTRRTGLARATVSSVLSDLIAAGTVSDEEPQGDDRAPQNGRPARLLTLAPAAAYALGIDIGHDHVRCMLCDLSGRPRWDRQVSLAVDDAPGDALRLATDLIAEATADLPGNRVLGVGVGIACPVDQRTGTLYAEGIMPGWVDVRPIDELTATTGHPVRIINDANAGVLAESRYGVAQHSRDTIYLRVSPGIGLGVISAGRMLLGARGLAGELGHVSVDAGGDICRCGNRGCLETVASPAAVARLLSRSWSRTVTTGELIELIDAADRGALRALGDAADAIGRALAATIMILNPQQVVVGGELAAAGEALLEPLRQAIQRNTMRSHLRSLDVTAGDLGDSAGVRGAAALVLIDAPQRLADALAG